MHYLWGLRKLSVSFLCQILRDLPVQNRTQFYYINADLVQKNQR